MKASVIRVPLPRESTQSPDRDEQEPDRSECTAAEATPPNNGTAPRMPTSPR